MNAFFLALKSLLKLGAFFSLRGVRVEKLRLPVIAVNFKVYETSVGANALSLAKTLSAVAKKQKASILFCVSATDIAHVSAKSKFPVFAQHVDGVSFGAHTGSIPVALIKEAGAAGSLINHSEKRISHDEIKSAIDALRVQGLLSMVCAKDAHEAKDLAHLNPDYIAVEPPELIGGDVSVTTADPKVIRDTLWLVHEVSGDTGVLCGAGVKTADDVRTALEFGCCGVLLASGITKVEDPAKALDEMIAGLQSRG